MRGETSDNLTKKESEKIFQSTRPVRGETVFCRFVIAHMDQRPLPAAKCEMLQTGELKEVVFVKPHQ